MPFSILYFAESGGKRRRIVSVSSSDDEGMMSRHVLFA